MTTPPRVAATTDYSGGRHATQPGELTQANLAQFGKGTWQTTQDGRRAGTARAILADGGPPVSYTHLTLPTIYSV